MPEQSGPFVTWNAWALSKTKSRPSRCAVSLAALEIESHPGVDFADLAVRLGWYDQAHFINDFRSMLGSTPGEYVHAHGG